MRVRAGLAGALLLLAAGCGVEPQERPERLTIPAPSTSEPGTEPDGGPEVVVYFVRDADLAPVERGASGVNAAGALEELSAGPTRGEVLSGLRTALSPQSLSVDQGLPGGLTAVSVTREFTDVAGGNQLLAVAQVVWTLTELPGTTEVRFLVDGAPVEVPTDDGLTDQPVGREDYRSVAPVDPPEPTPTTPPSSPPAPPRGTSPTPTG